MRWAWLVVVLGATGCKGLQLRNKPVTATVTKLDLTLADSTRGRMRCTLTAPTFDVKEVVWELWLDSARLAAGVQSALDVSVLPSGVLVAFDAPIDLRVFPFKVAESFPMARLKGRLVLGESGGGTWVEFADQRVVQTEGRPVKGSFE